MSLQRVVRDIASLKIQGAEAVGMSAVKAVEELVHTSKTKNPHLLWRHLQNARKKLFSARPTEPYLRNALMSVFRQIETKNDIRKLREEALAGANSTIKHMKESKEKIIEIGSRKIKNGMVVFTHCRSSTVMRILLRAKKNGKRFEVHNTETRPMFQGRKTAKELSKAGIPVTHYVDSAARIALKKADIMLIGADAITSEGKVINKIGSELFAIAAQKVGVPLYCCTDSWKFDSKTIFGYTEEIEQRPKKEVWKNSPKKIRIDNHAFEKIEPELISGVISELGIYKPEMLMEAMRRNYSWMF